MSPFDSKDDMEDKTVEDYIYGNNTRNQSKSSKEAETYDRLYSPDDDEFLEIPSSAGLPAGINWREEGLFHGRESYSSFGEKGTTASVNAYGSILQISRYLGTGTSGIFCADTGIHEPWSLHNRMKELLDLSTDATGGFGLCLNLELASPKPRLQFLHNRWPQYTHNIGDLSVSIQYFANRGAVLQQYLFQRTQEHEAKNGAEGSNSHAPRSADDDVSQNLQKDDAVKDQTEATQAQCNQVQDDGNQNRPLSENCAQEGQTECPLPQNETQNEIQNDGTLCSTQKKISIKDCLRLNPSLQIRESEWVDDWNRFNYESPIGGAYDTVLGRDQYSLVVRHRLPSTDDAVGLIIAVFINGRATKIDSDWGTYEINLDSEDVEKFEQGQKSRLEITVAYQLRLLPKDSSWKSTLIPVSVLNLSDLMAQTPHERSFSLSKSAHLDYIMKRNLEHILSVCSIPVSTTPIQEDKSADGDVFKKSTEESQLKTEESERRNPIALTCGDISGHHVLMSASFFAFQFLLTMYSISRVSMKKRILETLRGYLEWVFLHIEKDPTDSGQFLGGYWANGREIKRLRKYRNSQHTTLQIINARNFASKLQGSGKIPSWFLDNIDGFVEEWILCLREIDSRDYCVFPRVSSHGDEEGYYLRDHVLIWKALGIIEVLEDLRSYTNPRGFTRRMVRYLEEKDGRDTFLGIYTSDQAKRRILKRFTTHNAMTKERMLAIYRDNQDNSFLLDTEDTILFYDEQEFFHDTLQETNYLQQYVGRSAVREEWVRTLDVQTRRKSTDDKDWQEPLQYALAIQMAKCGHRIDSRPVSDIFDEALKVLLQSSSASGIFPGFLTRESKLPDTFNEGMGLRWSGRDSYWHASFEVPYILWIYAKERMEKTSGQDKAPLEKSASANQRKTNKQPEPQTDQPIHERSFMPKLLRAKTVLGGKDFTDQKNVFEISDEWLVPCPEFLHLNPTTTFGDLLQVTTQRESSDSKLLRRFVIDISKRRNETDGQTVIETQPSTSEGFLEKLQQWRTKTNMLIKKRIICLSSSDKEAVSICPATVPESEQPALTGFFRKHNNCDKYFLDDPSASNNSWKTEFQLSFYQLEKPGNGAPSTAEIALAKRIRRASMGFRFNGDFFDCYWTCHIINFGDWLGKKRETKTLKSAEVGSSEVAIPGRGSKKRAWHQRKVLELVLFEEIIRKVTAGTQEILGEIKDVLASTNLSGSEESETNDLPDKVKETVLFSKIDGNAYFSFSARWEVIQQLLQVLDEDLSDTVKKIENWQDRENNRGTETPRWTKKDEKRYRPALRRMQLSNAESVRGLLQLQEKAQSLRSSLISRRDYIRDDLNLRGAENTRYFTYVTVVFLPLGFATGIFSMSETPAGSTLARMSGTAAITFLLTVVVLSFVVDLFEAFKRCWAVLAKPLGKAKGDLERLLQRVNGEVNRFFPPLFITYVLLRALGELMANIVYKLRAKSAKQLARVKGEMERLLLPLFFAYFLWSMLGGSVKNFFNRRKLRLLPGLNRGHTNRRDSTAYLPEGSPQGQPARQRRSASRSIDLENQARSL